MLRHLLFAAGFAALSSSCFATVFASKVVSATVNNPGDPYNDPSVVLGAPNYIVGASDGFPAVLSPFNPAYEGSEIYTIRPGNSLTLDMGMQIHVGGPVLGVFANNGIDGSPSYDGNVNGAASLLSPPGVAVVSVSADNVTYHPLNGGAAITFDRPYNYFVNVTGPFDLDAPANPAYADFSKPFTQPLSSFDNQSFAGVLSVLNGSAGGTWVDASSSGLSQFEYVRFDVPSDGQRLILDAVSAVPEPTSIAMLIVPAIILAKRQRKS